MKFAITCPGCAKQFRSSNERSIGKGVECPKCGEQFYVTAKNQEKTDDPGRTRTSNRLRSAHQSKLSRARDDDGYGVDRDYRGSHRFRKKRIAVLIAVGVLVLAVGGIGVALIFSGQLAGSGDPSTSTAKRIRTQRDLPREMFLYNPGKNSNYKYFNVAEMRQTRAISSKREELFQATIPPGSGLTLASIDAFCMSSLGMFGEGASAKTVAIRLGQPVRAAEIASALKFQPLSIGNGNAFASKVKFEDWALLQVAENRIVFVYFTSGTSLDQKLLSNFLARTTDSHQLSPDAAECLSEVSGYPNIYFDAGTGRSNEIGCSAKGRYVHPDGTVEVYDVRIYESEGSAKSLARVNKNNRGSEMREMEIWTKGKRYFVFSIENPKEED